MTSRAPAGATEAGAAPRVEALEVFASLLSELDPASGPRDFYDRLCEAVCRLTTMERAGLFLYDESLKRVRARGFHNVPPGDLGGQDFTLDDAPIAERALAEDQVVEISEDFEHAIPARYAALLGVTTLTCTPVSAADRWYGVILADRGGGRFALTDAERHAMWTVGKVAALAASARIATRQQDRVRELSRRIDLAREIHERAMQRIFGISLALGSEHELSDRERARCREEAQAALAELRTAMTRPLAPRPRETGTTLRAELERLARRYRHLPLTVRITEGLDVPTELEALAQSVVGEAMRNVDKHARPTRVEIGVERAEGNLTLEVVNDGVADDGAAPGDRPGAGIGLRIAALEALQLGGVLEFGPGPGSERTWRLRLVVPLPEEAGRSGGAGR